MMPFEAWKTAVDERLSRMLPVQAPIGDRFAEVLHGDGLTPEAAAEKVVIVRERLAPAGAQ